MSALALVLAAAAGPLELAEVVESATRHHPTVLSALAELEGAEAEALASRGAFDPMLKARAFATPYGGYPNGRLDAWVEVPTPLWGAGLSGGYRLGAGSFPLYYGERETDDWGELRAGLTVPLLRNGPTDRRRANVERAALGTRVAQLNAQAQRLELRRQGAVRWLRWVAAGERLALARQLLELAQARQVQLETRARSGDLPAIDALDNRRAITQREGVVVSARRSLEEAANELSLFVRDERGAPVQVDPARLPRSLSAPSPAPAAVSLDEALSRRPDLARLEAQRGQAAVEVGLARNQLLPALDLGAFVSKDLGPSSDAKRSVAELELMVSLEVPLLYRQLFGRLDGAAASERRAALQVQLQQERVRVEIADGLSASRAAAERAALMTRELELARALEDGERRRFELGDSNLFLVNLRETQTFEAALREVDARADWHRASADLTAALAAP